MSTLATAATSARAASSLALNPLARLQQIDAERARLDAEERALALEVLALVRSGELVPAAPAEPPVTYRVEGSLVDSDGPKLKVRSVKQVKPAPVVHPETLADPGEVTPNPNG